MSPVTTSVEALEGNKVRLTIAVPEAEFDQAIAAAFRKLAGQVKIPGFRPGKAPRQLVEARLGAVAGREQALRDAVPTYYADAIAAEDLDAIAPPEIDITAGEEHGDLAFDAVVEVRPVVQLAGYEGLRVEIPSIEIPDTAVDAQIDGLRERFADLEEKQGPLADGDYAEIDCKAMIGDEAFDALSATDYLYEVGSGLVVAKLDDELRGKRPGDIVQFEDLVPEPLGARAGEPVTFRVLVKNVKRKVLPEATDEWVSEVSEYETLDELERDARNRLELYAKVQAQLAVRDKTLVALSELVEIEVPDALVNRELEQRLHDLMHRLEQQGATIPQYLAAIGQDSDAFVAEVRQEALRAVKADLGLRAVVVGAGIVATDDDVEAEVARIAQRADEKPAKVRRDLEQRGLIEAVRFDVARGKALQYLVDHAAVVDESGQPVDLALPSGDAAEETSGTQAPSGTQEEESSE
jgi:trigger factor